MTTTVGSAQQDVAPPVPPAEPGARPVRVVDRLSRGRPGSSRFKRGLPAEATWIIALGVVAYLGSQVLRPGSGVTALDVLSLALVPLTVRVLRGYVWITRYCVALVVWAAAILLSSVVNGTGVSTVVDDLALPGLQLTALLVMVWLTHRLPTAVPVILAALLSQAYFVLYLYELPYANAWKYGLATPVICLVLLGLAGTALPRTGGVVALVGLAGVCVLRDARSLAGVCLLAALLLVVIRPKWRERSAGYFYSRSGIALAAILAGVAGLYAVAAGGGYLGAGAEQKFVEQSAGGNMLLVARPELLFSFRAITASPVFGHGGAPSLTVQDVTDSVGRLSEAGALITEDSVDRIIGGGVNAHSMLFQSWIDAGILAVVPWLLLIALGMRAIRQAPARWQPLVIFWTLIMTWDVLFSPWTPHVHFMIVAYVVLVCRVCQDDGVRRPRQPRRRGRGHSRTAAPDGRAHLVPVP
jgi:hypothetical protein